MRDDPRHAHAPGVPRAAFHERYPPERARRPAARAGFVYTPVHGGRLNVAECGFSAMARQSLGHRRPGEIVASRRESDARVAARNAAGSTVGWQFTTPTRGSNGAASTRH